MSRILKTAVFMLLPLLLSTTCETNRGQLIPYVDVNINLSIYGDLANLGPEETMLIEDVGASGIILYRNSYDQYFAFDRTCTMWPDHTAAVEEDDTFDGVFVCPECGSKFLITNDGSGMAISGEAVYALVQYNTYLDGNILHIYN